MSKVSSSRVSTYVSGIVTQEGGAEDLRDFRPISLLGGLYKLLVKVLANRLKKVIGKVVSLVQNAFVMGRRILDASLIANAVIDAWQKREEKGLISKFSVLVNGVSTGFFLSSKGLRQGDPLSSYLFVMGMEVLSTLIRRVVEGGFLPGCRIRGAASGLRINLDKSEIIPVGEVEEMEEMAAELGCRVGSMPSVYLGLPLGAPNKATSVWDGVEERSVAQRLEKLQRDFLWGGGNLERKVHLVNWEVVCTEKEKGGLGLRKLVPLNKALLGKWIWRFACEKENLWKQVLLAKIWARGFWLEDQKGNFLHVLRGYKPTLEEDSVYWKGGRNGQFKVKEAYNLVVNTVANNFPKSNIWVHKSAN
ncbi:putative ribonuclease H protein [Vitis vinifera]|uniref:Putative ribonuclease H protein n=1 Tax=Vitis vinifera TaxID=29760 RepID=A0A438F490_VITVI|nr:putative ribonuclease H protein [Vitis vinifera]